jgi:hypothetical protein
MRKAFFCDAALSEKALSLKNASATDETPLSIKPVPSRHHAYPVGQVQLEFDVN